MPGQDPSAPNAKPSSGWWTHGRVALALLASAVLLLFVYLLLLATPVFDIKPVPRPDLERIVPEGRVVDMQKWCEADSGFQDWKKWADEEKTTSDEREVEAALSAEGGKPSEEERRLVAAWADEAARVPVLVRRMVDQPGRWDRTIPPGTSPFDLNFEYEAGRVRLARQIRILAAAAALDPARRPGTTECAELAARLAVRSSEDARNAITGLIAANTSIRADYLLLLAAREASRRDQSEDLERLAASAASQAPLARPSMADGLRGEFGYYRQMTTWMRDHLWESGRHGLVHSMGTGGGGPSFADWWIVLRLQPNREAAEAAPEFLEAIRQIETTPPPSPRPAAPPPGWRSHVSLSPNAGGRTLRPLMGGMFSAYVRTSRTLATSHSLVQTTVALARFRAANDNRLPDNLDALVPRFLPSLPLDPMDGKPLRYDAGRARLWSIGNDLVDGGGREPDPAKQSVLIPPGTENLGEKPEPTIDLKGFFGP